MKKTIAFLLSSVMIIVLSACNYKPESNKNETETPITDTEPAITTEIKTDVEKVNITYPIVDTNVTTYYNNDSVIKTPQTDDVFYYQDASFQKNMPDYTDNKDGTITDNVTKLMWQKEMPAKMTFDEAVSYAESCTLGGYSDWRIPNIKELYSLIEFTGRTNGEKAGESRFIDTDYFIQPLGDTSIGEREIDAQTWSCTKYTGKTINSTSTYFGVNFIDGRIKGYPEYKQGTVETTHCFRLVRGNTEYGKNNFIDNNDGTITDLATGLMWQKEDSGTGMTWDKALEYCHNLTLGGYDDWILPDIKELQSIVDYTRSPQATNSPAIDPLFTCSEVKDEESTRSYPYYWSSTTHLDGKIPESSAAYIAFGEASGKMNNVCQDVHGAGAQRSDPKTGKAEDYPTFQGPQGDLRIVFNYARAMRYVDIEDVSSTPVSSDNDENKDKDNFTFVVQADTHMDDSTDYDLLSRSFSNIAKSNPELILDLGDTLMLGENGKTKEEMIERAKLVKDQFSVYGSIPVYLINGNHDGENSFTPKIMQWSQEVRNMFFPANTDSENFSGNTESANYYTFTKNNVRFIVLDAYSYAYDSGGGWNDTLGNEQYQWLENTLKNNKETFTFVFIHNLLGGTSYEHRGGAAVANLFEWGGYNLDGEYEFHDKRPDFSMPIHNLLVKYNVNAVFHGHDHFYADEISDNIHYILVPKTGTETDSVANANINLYSPGTVLPAAGFMFISVNGTQAELEYRRTDNSEKGYSVADSFTISAD